MGSTVRRAKEPPEHLGVTKYANVSEIVPASSTESTFGEDTEHKDRGSACRSSPPSESWNLIATSRSVTLLVAKTTTPLAPSRFSSVGVYCCRCVWTALHDRQLGQRRF